MEAGDAEDIDFDDFVRGVSPHQNLYACAWLIWVWDSTENRVDFQTTTITADEFVDGTNPFDSYRSRKKLIDAEFGWVTTAAEIYEVQTSIMILPRDDWRWKLSSLWDMVTLETDNPILDGYFGQYSSCLLYTSPSPRDLSTSRMPSSA